MDLKITEVIKKLDEADNLRKNSQKDLLSFCEDKSFDIEKRFSVWEKHCLKKESGSILDKKDFKSKFIGYLVSIANSYYERRNEITYETLFDILENEDDVYIKIVNLIPELKRDSIIESILKDRFDLDEYYKSEEFQKKLELRLKEELIQENFGSYTIDW